MLAGTKSELHNNNEIRPKVAARDVYFEWKGNKEEGTVGHMAWPTSGVLEVTDSSSKQEAIKLD